MDFNGSSVLRRITEIDFSLESNGQVTVRAHGASVRLSHLGLSIIDAFQGPSSIIAAAKYLANRLPGEAAVDDFVADIAKLLQAGILSPDTDQHYFSSHPYPLGLYDSPALQIQLLNDEVRRSAFLKAIRETVCPGNVVLDLGTGCGIMAVAAVKAGAKRVYAIEPGRISAAARKVFVDNGVNDRVTLVENWVQSTTLAELGDVLVSDLIGFQALDMAICELTNDSVRRLLKSNAQLIPRRINFSVCVVELPEDTFASNCITRLHVNRWKEWYNIDFTALSEPANLTVSTYLSPSLTSDLRFLSDIKPIWQINLGASTGIPFQDVEVVFDNVAASHRPAIMGIADIQLSESVWFSTRASSAGNSPHWMVPLWLPTRPNPHSGGSVVCRYTYLGRGRIEIRMKTNG